MGRLRMHKNATGSRDEMCLDGFEEPEVIAF
jgi:hypothetical protein